jgi:hypothetical protein
MAPYLAGLLVLLGMLGTFLGMVLTLRGTGMALDSATDIQAVRTSLVAPVKGLGLAFGTSVAGVATSAALGLLSALSRRERVQAAQSLDARIATTLRVFSVAHQREESLKLLQRQADMMPALVDSLQRDDGDDGAPRARIGRAPGGQPRDDRRHAQASHDRLLASQDAFHGKAEAAYATLASSVDRSLKDSLTDSARAAGETIRPVVEATLAGIARETASLHASLAGTVQGQADELSTRFDALTATVADSWQAALARHERTSQGLSENLHAALDRSAQTFEQRSASLLESVAQRHAASQQEAATAMAGMARDTAAMQERSPTR